MARRRALRPAGLLAFALLLPAAGSAVEEAPAEVEEISPDATVLLIAGMTFVGSRGSESEVIVRAEHATFLPDTDIAKLQVVRASVTHEQDGKSFEMTCDRADLDVETHDFFAEGNVSGVTGDGQRYRAPWVRYEHEQDLMFTDAPVEMVDASGSFRGDGFRYHVGERRFRLLGNVTVVQGR